MSAMDGIFASLAKLGVLAEDAAKLGAPLVDAAIKQTVRAGETPEGGAWKPKRDGGAPLVHAADHISTKAVGTVIRTTLEGPTVFHNFGSGSVRRQVLPDPGTIPDGVGKALQQAAVMAFAKAVQ